MKHSSSNLGLFLGLTLLLAGCQSLPERFASGKPLSDKETKSRLELLEKGLYSASNSLYRYSADLKVASGEETHTLNGVCLWQPGQNVRWRFRYLGHTLFSALGNKERWLLYFEDQGAVYACPAQRLGSLQSAEIPRGVWQLLERSRLGFLPQGQGAKGYALEAALLIEEETEAYKSWLAFDETLPPLPQQALFEGQKGQQVQAVLTRPEPCEAKGAFLPMTNGYKAIRL